MRLEQKREKIEKKMKISYSKCIFYQARIIGGSIAQPSEFVSMAALVDVTEKGSPDGPIFCGAAISNENNSITFKSVNKFLILSQVSENYALTAAHCFDVYRDISVIYLLVGDHDISRGDETPYAALYASKRILKHSGYVGTSENKNDDIALLQTLDPMRWKRTIGPACLPYLYKGYDTYFDDYPLTGERLFLMHHSSL